MLTVTNEIDKQAETSLAALSVLQGDERTKIFIEQTMHAVAMLDKDMCYLAASARWKSDYNLHGQELSGRSHYELFPEIGEGWKTIHRECLGGATNVCEEAMFLRQDGSVQWISWEIRPWHLADGRIGGLLISTSDITKRKAAEKERSRMEEIISKTNEIARIGAWELDFLTDTATWTKMVREILELDDDFVPSINSGIEYFKEGDSRERITNAIATAIEHGIPYDLELELITARNKPIWVRSIGQAEFREGKCIRLFGVFQDIDNARRVQDELTISETQFERTFENSLLGMGIVSTTGRWLRVNNGVCGITGYAKDELLAKTILDITHPDDRANDLVLLGQLLRKEIDSYQIEKRYYHKQGHIVWISLVVSMVADKQGNPVHFIGQIEDITSRKEAQSALLKMNQELNAILDTAHVSIIGTDTNGVVTHFNRGAEILLGYKAAEVIGIHTPVLIHLEEEVVRRGRELSVMLNREIKGFDVFVETARQASYESREWTYITKEGKAFPVQLVVTAIKTATGSITGYLGIATDMSQRKAFEASERRYAILESKSREMEQFAYMASHYLREPLLNILGCIQIVSEEYADGFSDDLKSCFNGVSDAATRMDGLIKGLLDYTRLSRIPHMAQADTQTIAESALAELYPVVSQTKAVVEIGPLPLLRGNVPALKQLFVSLLHNALKFQPEGSTPLVRLSALSCGDEWAFEIRDNGIGLPANANEKIFSIFQRLHKRDEYGGGLGVGLSLCKKIVELHQGAIAAEAGTTGGATFRFTISQHL